MGVYYTFGLRHKDAIAAFEKAIALKPDYAEAYLLMGVSYKELEQYEDAMAAYKKGITLEPTGEHANSARKLISEIEKRD